MTRTASILIAIVALLVAAAPAQAGWKIDRAKRIAAAAWDNPCNGNVKLTWGDTDARGQTSLAHEGWNAMTTWGQCPGVITIAPTNKTTWREFCTMVIHEYGHIAKWRDPVTGAYHSENPHDVMFSVSTWDIVEDGVSVESIEDEAGNVYKARPGGGDPRCVKRGRPFLRSLGLL